MRADEILNKAAGHIADRAASRDTPEGERSMARTVAAFNALFGTSLTEVQGWLFMALLKAARASAGGHNPDDYEDGAAYFALAGECAGRTAAIKKADRKIAEEVFREISAQASEKEQERRTFGENRDGSCFGGTSLLMGESKYISEEERRSMLDSFAKQIQPVVGHLTWHDAIQHASHDQEQPQ